MSSYSPIVFIPVRVPKGYSIYEIQGFAFLYKDPLGTGHWKPLDTFTGLYSKNSRKKLDISTLFDDCDSAIFITEVDNKMWLAKINKEITFEELPNRVHLGRGSFLSKPPV